MSPNNPASGYTGHGHPYGPNPPIVRPLMVARCGGPGMCSKCSTEVSAASSWSSPVAVPPAEPPDPAEFDEAMREADEQLHAIAMMPTIGHDFLRLPAAVVPPAEQCKHPNPIALTADAGRRKCYDCGEEVLPAAEIKSTDIDAVRAHIARQSPVSGTINLDWVTEILNDLAATRGHYEALLARIPSSHTDGTAAPTQTPVLLAPASVAQTELGAGTPVVPEAVHECTPTLRNECTRCGTPVPFGGHVVPTAVREAAEAAYYEQDVWSDCLEAALEVAWAAALSHIQAETAAATPERVRHTWQETYWKANGRQRSTAICTTCQMHTECGSTDYYSSCSGVMVDGR